jgi:hypothetical protein
MEPVPSKLAKTYPPRGPLQQFRFEDSTVFACCRCGQTKKSKLITVYAADWSKRLCNGCYGRLLSLYDIKAGTAPDDERATALAAALLDAVAADDQRRAEEVFRTSEQRAQHICPEAVRFIATAEYVAGHLQDDPQLEWSPAVIGLCKAVEVELVSRILQPLAAQLSAEDLTADTRDKDLQRIAAFCVDTTRKPPELGAFAHFLQVAMHSKQRRDSSVLLRNFLRLSTNWAGSHWLLDGLHAALISLTKDFRNPAAHIDELAKRDYLACRELVIGNDGILWKLVLSTQRHK